MSPSAIQDLGESGVVQQDEDVDKCLHEPVDHVELHCHYVLPFPILPGIFIKTWNLAVLFASEPRNIRVVFWGGNTFGACFH